MNMLLKLVVMSVLWLLIIFIIIWALFFMLISVVYTMGYVYDSIFGNFFVLLGHFIGGKYSKIKNVSLVVKVWEKIQPKELYLRYETPLFTYCFSYTAISMLALILSTYSYKSIFIASGSYIIFYFVGMARKCKGNKEYYKKVLKNNMDFLKLSFLPLGFIITVAGYYFTFTGTNVHEISFDFTFIINACNQLMNYDNKTNIFVFFLQMCTLIAITFIFFYSLSLPIQAMSYLFISFINYFTKYKMGYKELFKKYHGMVVCLFKNIVKL